VAAINGHAYAGGLITALGCDHRQAARGAVIDVLDAGLMAQPSGRTRPHA
jgi:enoyl-CoA hydratase/carnithine racemase